MAGYAGGAVEEPLNNTHTERNQSTEHESSKDLPAFQTQCGQHNGTFIPLPHASYLS